MIRNADLAARTIRPPASGRTIVAEAMNKSLVAALLILGVQPAWAGGSAPYEGRWTSNLSWCRNSADYTDQVPRTYGRRMVTSYASDCSVDRVTGSGPFEIAMTCRGEGQTWKSRERLEVAADRMRVSDLDRGGISNFRRCPERQAAAVAAPSAREDFAGDWAYSKAQCRTSRIHIDGKSMGPCWFTKKEPSRTGTAVTMVCNSKFRTLDWSVEAGGRSMVETEGENNRMLYRCQ